MKIFYKCEACGERICATPADTMLVQQRLYSFYRRHKGHKLHKEIEEEEDFTKWREEMGKGKSPVNPTRKPMTPEERELYLDENGNFKKGHPGHPRAGRKSKAEEMQYLYALMNGMPPELMEEVWRSAIDIAKEHAKKSGHPKQLLEVVRMMMNWGWGKPVQPMEVTDNTALEMLREMIKDDRDGDADETDNRNEPGADT